MTVRDYDCSENESHRDTDLTEKGSPRGFVGRDEEKSAADSTVDEASASHRFFPIGTGIEFTESFLVKWDGEDDSTHPQNWHGRRKWTVMALGPFSYAALIVDDANAFKSQYLRSFRLWHRPSLRPVSRALAKSLTSRAKAKSLYASPFWSSALHLDLSCSHPCPRCMGDLSYSKSRMYSSFSSIRSVASRGASRN